MLNLKLIPFDFIMLADFIIDFILYIFSNDLVESIFIFSFLKFLLIKENFLVSTPKFIMFIFESLFKSVTNSFTKTASQVIILEFWIINFKKNFLKNLFLPKIMSDPGC